MPGTNKGEAFSKVFKLRAQEVVDIKLLEFQEGFFDVVWTVISSQRNIHLDFGLLIADMGFKIDYKLGKSRGVFAMSQNKQP